MGRGDFESQPGACISDTLASHSSLGARRVSCCLIETASISALGALGNNISDRFWSKRVSRPGGQLPEYRWWITLIKITTRSKHYRKISIRRRIEIYAGAKRITELDFYPLSYYDKADELKEASLKRGKLWKKLNDGKPRVMVYQGDALSMVLENPPLNSRRYMPPVPEDEAEDGNCQVVRGSSQMLLFFKFLTLFS